MERSRFVLLPKSLRRPLSFVIDVGANQGQWITSLLALLPVTEVWIFEPNPAAMAECRRHLKRVAGVSFNQVALGSKAGKATLQVTKASDFSSLLQPNNQLIHANYGDDPTQIVAQQAVEVRALDALVPGEKMVDLLKIDVQGFEREALRGARNTLQRTTALLLEVNFQSHYQGDDTFPSLLDLLTRELGFQLWGLSPPYRGNSGQALWADALFVNPSRMSQQR